MKKNFHLSLLFEKLDGASVNTRLFFILYTREFWQAGRCVLSVRAMVKVFGIHNKAISEATGFLSSGGFLRQKIVIDGKKGRPLTELGIGRRTQELFEKLEKSPSRVLTHEERIEELLSTWEEQKKNESSTLGLKSAQILLLCVLYAHADKEGVVSGMTLADLTELTGLNNNQLSNSFKVLKGLGYMPSHKPGHISVRGTPKTSEFSLLVTKNSLRSTPDLHLEMKAFKNMQNAILLAHALYALKLTPPISDQARKLLEEVYQVNGQLFDSTLKCVNFLCKFKEIRGNHFKEFCKAICFCLEDLLINHRKLVDNDEFIGNYLRESSRVKKYIYFNKKINFNKKILKFIENIVISSKDEIYSEIKNYSEFNLKVISLKLSSSARIIVSTEIDSDAGSAS